MKMGKKKHNQKVYINTLLDVCIPVYRNIPLLENCLSHIPEAINGISTTITIFDNGTPKEEKLGLYPKLKGTSALLDSLKEAGVVSVNIIEYGQNIGFPRACNLGVRKGSAPLIFLLNSDIELFPNAIENAVKALDDPKIGVVGMKLLFPEKDTVGLNGSIRPAGKVQHVGLHTNVRSDFVHSFLGWSADHPKVMKVRDAYVVTGAALMTRRSLWKQIGGFFEGYGRGTFEDCDFCLSVRDLGYNIIVETKSVAYHYAGATAEKYQIPYPLQINKQILLSRWGNKLNWTEYLSW
jgi:GT2 family glycosyltransferase